MINPKTGASCSPIILDRLLALLPTLLTLTIMIVKNLSLTNQHKLLDLNKDISFSVNTLHTYIILLHVLS